MERFPSLVTDKAATAFALLAASLRECPLDMNVAKAPLKASPAPVVSIDSTENPSISSPLKSPSFS